MVIGNTYGGAASSQQGYLPESPDVSVCNDAQETAQDVTHRFLNSGKPNSLHMRSEIQPDSDLTWSVIARRSRYVKENFPSRSADLARIALGVVLMSVTREITAQDLVHFLHLAQGGAYLRSHAGQTFLYENGAFRLFNGVMPESVIQRCKEYSAYVEGCLWCIEKSVGAGASATFCVASGFPPVRFQRIPPERTQNAPNQK